MSEMLSNALIDAAARLPGFIVLAFFWTKVLDVRSIKAYWLVWLAIWLVQSIVRPFDGFGTVGSIGLFFVQMIVFPLAMSRGRLWYRVLVVASTTIAIVLSETFAMLFSALVGFNKIPTYFEILDDPVAYLVCQTVILLEFAVLFYLLYLVFARLLRQQGSPMLVCFGIGLFAQMVLTYIMIGVTQWLFLGEDDAMLGFAVAFALVNLCADALVLLSVSRANAAYAQNQRARLLRSRLDATLAAFKGLADEVQAVARFRHDLRAELQAAASLVRAGEYARAGALVDGLEHRIAPGQGGETR